MAVDVDARLAGAGGVGAHKTSMLQDLEAGRPMEVEALTGAVVELARLTGVATQSREAGGPWGCGPRGGAVVELPRLTGVATPSLDALDGMIRLLAARR